MSSLRLPEAAGPAIRLLGGVRRRASDLRLTDQAAALTYWGFLSLFPALIVAVAILALVGNYPETYRSIISTLRDVAPASTVDTVDAALKDALQSRGTAGGLLGVGVLLALYSATSGTGAALRAIASIYGHDVDRSWWRGYAARLGLTLAVMSMLLLSFSAVLVAGPIFSSIADAAGVDETVSGAIGLIRWPVGLLALIGTALVLYRVGSGERGIRSLAPGAVAAALLWLLASVGFNIYVSYFSSYDATYGSLGAVIVLLVWMWIGSLALLAGAALNVELEEERRD